MANTLATADFRIDGTIWNGEEYHTTVHAELLKSGAFQYGNGTCTIIEWKDADGRIDRRQYDTRYVKVTPFNKFAKKLIEDRCISTLTVTEV